MTSLATTDALRATEQPGLVDVPLRAFIALDGPGERLGPECLRAVSALLTISRMARVVLEHRGLDPVPDVRPPETLWPPRDVTDHRAARRWTALVEQPACVSADIVVVARIKAARTVPGHVLTRVRWSHWREGRCAQLLHLGPYDDTGRTIGRLHDFIRESGCTPRGRHHEIHLSDPARTEPSRLRTILRQPVADL